MPIASGPTATSIRPGGHWRTNECSGRPHWNHSLRRMWRPSAVLGYYSLRGGPRAKTANEHCTTCLKIPSRCPPRNTGGAKTPCWQREAQQKHCDAYEVVHTSSKPQTRVPAPKGWGLLFGGLRCENNGGHSGFPSTGHHRAVLLAGRYAPSLSGPSVMFKNCTVRSTLAICIAVFEFEVVVTVKLSAADRAL